MDRGAWQVTVHGDTESDMAEHTHTNTHNRVFRVFYYYSYSTKYTFGEGSGIPLQYSCLENPMDGGAW